MTQPAEHSKCIIPGQEPPGAQPRTPDRTPKRFITAGRLASSSNHFKSETWQNLCFAHTSEQNTKP